MQFGKDAIEAIWRRQCGAWEWSDVACVQSFWWNVYNITLIRKTGSIGSLSTAPSFLTPMQWWTRHSVG